MQRSEGTGKNRENTKARYKLVIRLFSLKISQNPYYHISVRCFSFLHCFFSKEDFYGLVMMHTCSLILSIV